MTQSLEEAWADAEQWFMEGQDDLRDAVRAVLIAGVEEAFRASGVPSIESPHLPRPTALRHRVKELGW